MTTTPRLQQQERFSYADYLTWPDDERWELIDGAAYMMSPAPSRRHQELFGNFHTLFHQHLKGKPCKVYGAPFDVRLPGNAGAADDDIDTVVQPDIVVVCDPEKLDDRGCKGAPDLILEILSPGTAEHDLKDKFYLYEQHGVREYWIIHPAEKTLLVYKIEADGMYGKPDRYAGNDKVAVPLLGDLVVDLGEVFTE